MVSLNLGKEYLYMLTIKIRNHDSTLYHK